MIALLESLAQLNGTATLMTVSQSPDYQAVLQQNREVLVRHAKRHDFSGVREIEIGLRYLDPETSRAARTFAKKSAIPKGISFRVRTLKYSDEDIEIDRVFTVNDIP